MNNNKWVRTLSLISQVGISMCVPIFICLFIGLLFDSTLLLIILLLLGVGAGFRNMFYMIMKEVKRAEAEAEAEAEE
ncbi:MAG: hypothetical protein BEN18_02895 [Epulopiscium sp. Nuni2H_MBin001]|nr:MAG: hypothetical protein BEN18_02895 [Epulopiscium sp. Nuni2H_MBin001]